MACYTSFTPGITNVKVDMLYTIHISNYICESWHVIHHSHKGLEMWIIVCYISLMPWIRNVNDGMLYIIHTSNQTCESCHIVHHSQHGLEMWIMVCYTSFMPEMRFELWIMACYTWFTPGITNVNDGMLYTILTRNQICESCHVIHNSLHGL